LKEISQPTCVKRWKRNKEKLKVVALDGL